MVKLSGSSKLRSVILSLCLFAIFSLLVACTPVEGPEPKPSSGAVARSASPPKVTQIDDAKMKELLKPTGKPLLVNFWATWCGPCREEFPDLVKIDNEYKSKIDFITVSLDFVDELETGVPKFLSEMNAGMPTYLVVSSDENELISTVSKDWSGALPFTVLFNENGVPAFSRQGKIDHDTLKGEIEKVLEY